jgi:hypothetical protein
MKPRIFSLCFRCICVGILLFASFFPLSSQVHAETPTCVGSVDQSEVSIDSTNDFYFSLNNTSQNTNIGMIKITRPSSNFTLNGYSSGWTGTQTDNDITLTDGAVGAGGSTSFIIGVTAGPNNAASAPWTITIAEGSDGTNPGVCTGSFSTAITGGPSGPVISNISVSGVSDSAVTVSWQTSSSSTGRVDYGTTTGYGSSKSDSTGSTSHTVAITGLTANTTYHYKVTGTDDTGSASSSDQTVTTADVGTTATPTPTTQPGATATPTPIPDNHAPAVTVALDTSKPFAKVPTVTGTAIDDHGVVRIEYTVNNGTSWVLVKTIASPGDASSSFSFDPVIKTTGKVALIVRALDASGNIGKSVTLSFTLDMTPPNVIAPTDFSKPFAKAPAVSGTATDPSGVGNLLYSLDGKNWIPISQVESTGTSATFGFAPGQLEDGTYSLSVRASDALGNTGDTKLGDMTIDRLPPLVGGNIIAIGPYILPANGEGVVETTVGIYHKLTLSAVGGPTSIFVRIHQMGDARDTTQSLTDGELSLSKNSDTGLWSGSFQFDSPGEYTLSATAIDGAKNTTQRVIGKVHVSSLARIGSQSGYVEGAVVRAFVMDPLTGQFVVWDGLSYGQQNPQKTNTSGSYGFFLPAGTYYLEVKTPGYKTLVTDRFTLNTARPLSAPLTLFRSWPLKIGPFTLPLPDFRYTVAEVTLTQNQTIPDQGVRALVGFEMPDFHLTIRGQTVTPTSLRGKNTIITLLNTWWPQASAQLSILEQLAKHSDTHFMVIIPQESLAKVDSYKKRGGYTLDIIADPDSTVVDGLKYQTIPVHILVNKTGKIEAVKSGLLQTVDFVDNKN